MSCCRLLTCFHFDAAGLKSKSEVWEELASREPGQARRRRGSLRQYFSSPGVCYISYYQKIIKIERKLQCLCGGWEKTYYILTTFFTQKNLFSLPPIQILDKKLFAQTIKGNVMVVPKPHVHSAILHLNRDCILYAFLPKYVDTKTFKVPTKSINTFRV